MLIALFRTILLYFLVLVTLRVLGKRQVGQLQPADLVFTILLSEILVIPMQDKNIPLLNTFIPVLVLIGLEILMSWFSLKNLKVRTMLQGNSLLVIRNGVVDEAQLRCLRFTMDDILEELRKKNIFDISTVQYAFVETDGTLSVLLKPEFQPATSQDVNAQKEPKSLPCVVISDGKIINNNFKDCGMDPKKFHALLKKKKIKPEDVLLMTLDSFGNQNIIRKAEKQ